MRKFLILFILVIAFSGYGWLGERCLCEQWVCEYRVDTIYVTQMDVSNGKSITSYFFNGIGIQAFYLVMNADSDYWWYDLGEITCDSARIDSINWELKIYANDADTVLFGYIDPTAGICNQANFVTTDTLIRSSNTNCIDTTLVFDQKIVKSNKRYFPYIYALDISNTVHLTRLILYYKAYNKRYGIPQ